jgi:transposase-like protein
MASDFNSSLFSEQRQMQDSQAVFSQSIVVCAVTCPICQSSNLHGSCKLERGHTDLHLCNNNHQWSSSEEIPGPHP